MTHLKPEEKIQLLKNLLDDPDDEISRAILMLDRQISEEKTKKPKNKKSQGVTG